MHLRQEVGLSEWQTHKNKKAEKEGNEYYKIKAAVLLSSCWIFCNTGRETTPHSQSGYLDLYY